MKLLFGLTILLLIAASLLADYQWKKWIAARKQDRDRDEFNNGGPPH